MNRQIDIGSVLDRVFGIYKDQFVVLFVVALIVNLVVALLGLIDGVEGAAVAFLAGLVLGTTLYTGMVVRLVQDLQDGRRDWSVATLLSSVGPVLVSLIVLGVLKAIGLAIGLALLLVPFLYLSTIWAVTAPVVVVEGKGAFAAFGRSRELVKGNGWSVFGVVFLVVVLTAVIGFVAGLVAGLIGGDIALFLFNWLLPALVSPLSALVAAVLYFSLRDGVAGPTEPEPAWPESYTPPSPSGPPTLG